MKLFINRKQFTLVDFFLYVLGFFLVIEWLRPLEQLTDTNDILVFNLFLVLSLTLAYLHVSPIISGALKTVCILYSLVYLFYEEPFFTFTWIPSFLSSLVDNLALVFNANWTELTSTFRSLLFFILLWLMAYLIDYWLIKRRRIFIFFLLTIVYITVLDTFTIYRADYAIIRTVIIGFTVMGILSYLRLKEKEGLMNSPVSLLKWMSLLLVFVCISAGIGYVTPKADPIWPDPVPFIKTVGSKGGEESGLKAGANRVGYGVDDAQLGGDFINDDTVVFISEVEKPHYWKVETKDTYTGKGWVQSEKSLTLNVENNQVLDNGGEIPFDSFVEGNKVKRTDSVSKVIFKDPFSYLLYPLGVKEVKADHSYIEIEAGNERGIFGGFVEEYTVSYEMPGYSLDALTHTDIEAFIEENPEMEKRYLQLPESLPKRVRDLAVDITKNDENIFAKVRSIESYFSSNGFSYSQSNVAVPEDGQDYVDQFLFETKIGYCDNFSTSMVTLLRSIGIPSRWVKGFTAGEFKKRDGEIRQYEVTNNNAHSWVEAYFPNIGWIAFEPTQGFTNANTYINDIEMKDDNRSEETSTENEEEQNQAQKNKKPNQAKEEQQQTVNKETSIKKWWDSFTAALKMYWEWIIGAIVIIVVSIYLLYKFRYKWLPYYYIWQFRNKLDVSNFPKAYLKLLHLLKLAGLDKKESTTLREYAKQIDHVYETDEMGVLTEKYEEFLYKGQLENGTWDELKELWENLIKRTTT